METRLLEARAALLDGLAHRRALRFAAGGPPFAVTCRELAG
jgi:hypothetical protein